MSACECAICYDGIDTARVVLPCSHTYHFFCISKWFCEQEKSSCPMCRTEMEPINDLPPASEEDFTDDEHEDEDEEELEISRADLDTLLRSLGGIGITAVMGQRLFYEDEPTGITEMDLNNICMANGARTLSSREWELLIANQMQVTISEGGERTVLSALTGLLAVQEKAVVKIQKIWRDTMARRVAA